MEDDVFCLDFAVLDVHLVPTQDDGDVVTHPHQVPVPVGNVLVGHSGRHVEHDDGTLALDVVPIPQTTKLLLPSRVPHVEPDGAAVGVEHQWVHLHTQRG